MDEIDVHVRNRVPSEMKTKAKKMSLTLRYKRRQKDVFVGDFVGEFPKGEALEDVPITGGQSQKQPENLHDYCRDERHPFRGLRLNQTVSTIGEILRSLDCNLVTLTLLRNL